MGYVSDRLGEARVVIVGAGAVGAAIAYRLAQAGARVSVVERAFPGSGTSGNSFAWLNSFGKQPRHYHDLNARSIREHESVAAEVGGDWLQVNGGLHWVHEGDPETTRQLQQKVRRLNEWGYQVDRTTAEIAMRELEPDLFIDPEKVSEVFVAHREGSVNAVSMVHALLHTAVRRHGAELIRAAVTGLSGSAHGIDTVTLDDGRKLSADVVVNAAGPQGERIAALAGAKLPVRLQKGALVVTAPAPVCLRRVVHAPESHVRPDGGGRLMLHLEPYDSMVTEDVAPPAGHSLAERAVSDAVRIIPGLRGVAAESIRVGFRAMPADGHPIIGFEPGVAGLYQAVTHSGITLSAILGRLVTEDLSGNDVPELAPYRPDRFAAPVGAAAS